MLATQRHRPSRNGWTGEITGFINCSHVLFTGLTWAVEVLEDHVGHEAPDVELDVAGLDLGLDDLLGGAEGEHGGLVQLPPLLAALGPHSLGLGDVPGDGLGQAGATLQLKLLTQRQQQVLEKCLKCRGRDKF